MHFVRTAISMPGFYLKWLDNTFIHITNTRNVTHIHILYTLQLVYVSIRRISVNSFVAASQLST